jgi:hypothetical protein
MSNSSLPKNSLDSYTITINNDTIDLSGISSINMSSDYSYSYSDTITLTGAQGASTYSITTPNLSSGTISVGPLDISSIEPITWGFGKEWIDNFPEWNRVQDMCEKYPGLKIAFDNFKVFYEMVKDDYDNPTPKK